MPPLFVDTWGWLVLADRKDPRHGGVSRLYKEWSGGRVTSDYVLDETLTLLFRRLPAATAREIGSGILESSEKRFIRLYRVDDAAFRRAWELRKRYGDKPEISFTDLTSFIAMQDCRCADVLTGDRHFEQVGLGFRCVPG